MSAAPVENPRAAARAARRRSFRFRAPGRAAPKRAALQLGLLLGVVDGGARGVTLEVWHPDATERGAVAFSGDVAGTWRQAQAVARRFAPAILSNGAAPPLPRLRADANITHVSGPSYGLAFTLLGVSALVDQPLPSDVVATAIVDDNGLLRRVDGLRAKIEALVRETEGVHRLFLAAEQATEAAAVLRDLAVEHRVRVHACRDVRAVCDAVFHSLWDALAERWRADPDGAVEVSRALLNTMMRVGAGFVALDACVRMAAALEDELRACGREEAWFAQTARRIAERYQGKNPAPIVVPDSIKLHRVTRLELLPHQIQAATERGDRSEAEAWERWRATADLHPIPDADVNELRVYGALARLRASWGQLPEALDDLLAIADAWLVLDPVEVSHAGCEAIRLAALLNQTDAFARADRALTACQGVANAVSRGYIAMARARAASLLGRDGSCFVGDDAEPWVECGERVDAQRRRFLVMCYCDQQRIGDAHRALAGLLDFEGDAEVQRALAQAHLAVAEGRGVAEAHEAVVSLCASEVDRLKTWRPEVQTDLRELLRWLRL